MYSFECERWLDIAGYEGLYQVSNLGRIKSLHKQERIMSTPKNSRDGYLRVNLKKNGAQKQCLVHKLVADAFIPQVEGLTQINHKDENKSNNRLSNLERCTAKYNSNYGTHIERVARKLSKEVECIETGIRYISAVDAVKRLGYSRGSCTHLNRCALGKEEKFAGFHWRYV